MTEHRVPQRSQREMQAVAESIEEFADDGEEPTSSSVDHLKLARL